MASPRSPEENVASDGTDAVGSALQVLVQGLCQLQEALHMQNQVAAAALREMERKLREKDDAMSALQQGLQETQERVAAIERTIAAGGSGGDGGSQGGVEVSSQSEEENILPRDNRNYVPFRHFEEVQSRRASLATAGSPPTSSAGEAPATGGAAAGGGEEPPSVSLLPQMKVPQFTLLTLASTATPSTASAREAPETGRAVAGGGEQWAAAALREMERKLQEKDDSSSALQQGSQEAQGRGTAVEGATASGGAEVAGGSQQQSGTVVTVEGSPQSEIKITLPRVEHSYVPLRHFEDPQSASASPAIAVSPTLASAREAPATAEAAAGGGEGSTSSEELPAPSSPTFSSCTNSSPASASSSPPPSARPSSSASQQDVVLTEEEESEKQRVELLVGKVKAKAEKARRRPSFLGDQLREATKEGRLSDVRRLIYSAADVNYIDHIGCTPLFHAVRYEKSTDVVKVILELGGDVNAVNSCGCTAMHWASLTVNSAKCIELLVDEGGNINARNEHGETPLHWASSNLNEGAVRALLAAGAKRDLKPWSGSWKNKTPFDIAPSPLIRDLLGQ